jgi:DNA mismatch endonuclease (patch repair protein)
LKVTDFGMVDIFHAEKRSEIMSRVRSKGNASTELRLIFLMKQSGIRGWRRGALILGSPDFIFRSEKIAVFVDGDFWHGNPKVFLAPKTRTEFWMAKIRRNRARDRSVNKGLKLKGWKVIRIWESSLKRDGKRCIKRLARIVAAKRALLTEKIPEER